MISIALPGCTPEPLGNYLKALGVFRLVAETENEGARGWWKDGYFWLGSKLNEKELCQYFLNNYSPSPIFAPWGGRPGFSSDGNKAAWSRLQRLLKTTDPRLERSRNVARLLVDTWSSISKAQKIDIIKTCRRTWPSQAVRWLDAAIAIEEEPHFGFLLGTGGNEGSADITNNFWKMIEAVIGLPERKHDNTKITPAQAEGWLRNALFAEAKSGGIGTTAGQHFPRGTEAPNHGQFFTGQISANPWDFILMMEGCIVFAGSVTRRLSTTGKGKAAFPFMLDGIAVGNGTLCVEDEQLRKGHPMCRAEFWMPIWGSPVSFGELQAAISEGRLQCHGGQPASHSTEALEAIGNLGVDRGFRSFRRTGLYMRRGKGYYISAPLGEYTVSSRRSSLLGYLADLKEFRRRLLSFKRDAPRRLLRAASDLEDAIFAALRADLQSPRVLSVDHLHRILLTTHKCELELATLPKLRKKIRPQPPLDQRWFRTRDGYPGLMEDSPSFRLAAAVASLTPWPQKKGESPVVDSLRPYLLPVVRKGRYWEWATNGHSTSAVWSRGNLVGNLAAVLRRRLIDASRSAAEGLPLWGEMPASFQDMLAFWRGEVDEARMEEMIHALSLLDWGHGGERGDPTPDLSPAAIWVDERGVVHSRWNHLPEHLRSEVESAVALPRAYSLLKLCFLGGRLPPRPAEGRPTVFPSGEEPYPPHAPEILSLLLANRASEALTIAARKLRAVGYPPHIPESAFRRGEFNLTGEECRRLAAMLLIPIRNPGILCAMLIRPTLRSEG